MSYTTYDLHTLPDGRVTGEARTNDNLDHGEPSEYAEWPLRFDDRDQAIKVCGRSRTGWAGREVTVRIDGERV